MRFLVLPSSTVISMYTSMSRPIFPCSSAHRDGLEVGELHGLDIRAAPSQVPAAAAEGLAECLLVARRARRTRPGR